MDAGASALSRLVIHAAALLLTVVILAPVVWLVVMSVAAPTISPPSRCTGGRRSGISRATSSCSTIAENSAGAAFTASLRNSLVVAGMATIAALVHRHPGRLGRVAHAAAFSWSLHVSVATYMLPPVALAVPLYIGAGAISALLNSVFGLALVYLTILAPFTTWLMKSSFDNVPFEIEQAAMMDGANLWQIMRIVTLPLAAPVLTTVGAVRVPAGVGRILLCPAVHLRPARQDTDGRDRRSRWRPRLRLRTDRDCWRNRRPAAGDDRIRIAEGADLRPDQRRRERMSPQGNITAEGVIAIDREMSRQHDDALASYSAAGGAGRARSPMQCARASAPSCWAWAARTPSTGWRRWSIARSASRPSPSPSRSSSIRRSTSAMPSSS